MIKFTKRLSEKTGLHQSLNSIAEALKQAGERMKTHDTTSAIDWIITAKGMAEKLSSTYKEINDLKKFIRSVEMELYDLLKLDKAIESSTVEFEDGMKRIRNNEKIIERDYQLLVVELKRTFELN